MKYCFATLAVGEPYESITKEFFTNLISRTNNCDFFVTTTNAELTHESDRVKINVINPPSLRTSHNKVNFNFHLNLKCLSIKHILKYEIEMLKNNANFEKYDFVIFCDGDWSMHEDFSEQKIISMLERMENDNVDFLFERPAYVREGKKDLQECFFRIKLEDYCVFDHEKWDEAHVVNEQFLVFKNNKKLKFFTQRWEMFLWYSIANDISSYPDGFEIGVSALEAGMKYEYFGYFNYYLNNCFSFLTKYGEYKKRF